MAATPPLESTVPHASTPETVISPPSAEHPIPHTATILAAAQKDRNTEKMTDEEHILLDELKAAPMPDEPLEPASTRLLAITELVENILEHVPAFELLTTTQLVCRDFKGIIERSMPLQEKLLFQGSRMNRLPALFGSSRSHGTHSRPSNHANEHRNTASTTDNERILLAELKAAPMSDLFDEPLEPASTRLLAITELVENIFIHVPALELLTTFQHVNHEFKDIIKNALPIQEKLLFCLSKNDPPTLYELEELVVSDIPYFIRSIQYCETGRLLGFRTITPANGFVPMCIGDATHHGQHCSHACKETDLEYGWDEHRLCIPGFKGKFAKIEPRPSWYDMYIAKQTPANLVLFLPFPEYETHWQPSRYLDEPPAPGFLDQPLWDTRETIKSVSVKIKNMTLIQVLEIAEALQTCTDYWYEHPKEAKDFDWKVYFSAEQLALLAGEPEIRWKFLSGAHRPIRYRSRATPGVQLFSSPA